jgi:O-antigen ligase
MSRPATLARPGGLPRLTTAGRLPYAATIGAAAALNCFLALVMLHRSVKLAALVAVVPVLVLVLGQLVQSAGSALVFAALALPLSTHVLNVPHSGIWLSDLIALSAIGAGAARALIDLGGDRAASSARTYWPRLPATGLLFVLFAGAMVVAAYRGHLSYHTQIVGQPLRLVIYAGIACAMTRLSAEKAYRGIVAVLYVGTVWMTLNAAYYLATGTSQVDTQDLSTGGTRILSGTVAIYMASALVLALLNLGIDPRRRTLHLVIAALAAGNVMLGFTRAVYVGLAVPLLFLVFQRRVRGALLQALPLCVPFLVIGALAIGHFAPSIGPTFVDRISASPSKDANVQWRQRTTAEVLRQVRSSPLYGVGFGRTGSINITYTDPNTHIAWARRQPIGQDPHNSFLYLLAGGGLLVFCPFVLMLIGFGFDVRRRLAGASPVERTLLVWAGLTLTVFAASALAGTLFEGASEVLAMWVVLTLPAVVRRPNQPASG